MADEYTNQREIERRDMFAVQAMNGLIMNGNPQMSFNDSSSPDMVSKRAYEFADAMMKARSKP